MAYSKENVAGCIRANRAKLRMSRDDLSKASGIPAATLGCYENAESGISFENAWKLADVFGLPLDELFDRSKPGAA